MKPGDLVTLNPGPRGDTMGFRLWDDPYPFSDDEPKFVDHFWAYDVGLILEVADVPHRRNIRAGGTYVKLLNPRGKMGWIIGSNLRPPT